MGEELWEGRGVCKEGVGIQGGDRVAVTEVGGLEAAGGERTQRLMLCVKRAPHCVLTVRAWPGQPSGAGLRVEPSKVSGRPSGGGQGAEAAEGHPRDTCCSRACTCIRVSGPSPGATPGWALDKPTAPVGNPGHGRTSDLPE